MYSKRGDPEKNISYGEAIWMYEEKNFGKSVVGVGSFAHDGDKDIYVKNEGNYAPAYSFSTGAARVEVDEETGCIDIQISFSRMTAAVRSTSGRLKVK